MGSDDCVARAAGLYRVLMEETRAAAARIRARTAELRACPPGGTRPLPPDARPPRPGGPGKDA
jgi:hypothetical protein